MLNLSPSTVYKYVRCHEQNGNLKTILEEEGRKLSTSNEMYLKMTSLGNRRKSGEELTRDLEVHLAKK